MIMQRPSTQGRHALIILRGHECVCVCGGGGVVMWHTAAIISLMFLCFIYFFLFIQNIPKRINYIMKYLDSHLYRLCKLIYCGRWSKYPNNVIY